MRQAQNDVQADERAKIAKFARSLPRSMMTKHLSDQHRKAISFFIQLAQTNPAEILAPERLGDLLNLTNDLARFGLGRMLVDVSRHSRAPSLTKEMAEQIKARPRRTLGPLIEVASSLLDAAADGHAVSLPLPSRAKLAFDFSGHRQLAVSGLTGGANWKIGLGESYQTVYLTVPDHPFGPLWAAPFAFNIMRTLDSPEGIMVRRCRREKCHKVYLAARPKQMFCSRQCTNAELFEKHKREKGEEYRIKHRQSVKESLWRRSQKSAEKGAQNP